MTLNLTLALTNVILNFSLRYASKPVLQISAKMFGFTNLCKSISFAIFCRKCSDLQIFAIFSSFANFQKMFRFTNQCCFSVFIIFTRFCKLARLPKFTKLDHVRKFVNISSFVNSRNTHLNVLFFRLARSEMSATFEQKLTLKQTTKSGSRSPLRSSFKILKLSYETFLSKTHIFADLVGLVEFYTTLE